MSAERPMSRRQNETILLLLNLKDAFYMNFCINSFFMNLILLNTF